MDDAWNDVGLTDAHDEDENDPDYNPANEQDSDDESDDAVNDLSDDEPEQAEPIQRVRTENKRALLEGEALSSRVGKVLDCIESEGMDLAIFLDAVSWGDVSCHKDRRIQYARTSLFVSSLFPEMIRRWHRPPRATEKQKGKRPMGAREIMQDFAIECVMDRIDREMKSSAHLFLSPPEELNERRLLDFDLGEFKASVKEQAPTVWKIFERAACSPEQETKKKLKKNQDTGTLSRIFQCQYNRSHRRGRFQKLWAIYLKACGLSARAFDAIHALGLAMSHKWTSRALNVLSKKAMEAAQVAFKTKPCTLNHNNVNLPLRVFSQRLHNESHFVNATAGTVWVLPERARLSPMTNRILQTFRASRSHEMFPLEEVVYGNSDADRRMEEQFKFRVLRTLLDSPEFSDYKDQDHPSLSLPPLPTEELRCGKENIINQFILGTAELEEASYEGTLKVMAEFFKQLGISSEEETKKTGLERLIIWLGDQLSVERLRGLWRYRQADHNSFDRLDYMIPMFGWFHLVMAFANSLHKQYLGTSSGTGGLRHAFDLVKRKGLVVQSTKGPFWHHLDEAIQHISAAHFRASWMAVANVQNLSELKDKSAMELVHLSNLVYQEQCSQAGLAAIENMDIKDQDQVKYKSILWNIDVLPYLELREAIKVGDVGRMEDLIPTLLVRFAGGGNSKYAIEMLELLQGLRREWPPEVKKFIKEWCWLMNRTGARDGFLPYDLGQEQNIADIKVNYRSLGPGATMEYLKKISPVIPLLRRIQRHMEEQFKTLTRGTAHGVPKSEQDIALLTAHYVKSEIHKTIDGRRIKSPSDIVQDFTNIGSDNLVQSSAVNDWWKRRSCPRATSEFWEPLDIAMDTD